jgi:hypothetical protein
MVAQPVSTEPADPPGSAAREVRGSRIALAGLAFCALFVVAWLLLRGTPDLEASDGQLRSYYGDPDQRRSALIAGLYVVPLAGVAFIWFMAALRDRYVRSASEHLILSTAHVVAGALVVVSLFTLASVELAVVWLAETQGVVDIGSTRSLLALGQATQDIIALRAAAVFVGISASRAMRVGWRGFAAVSAATALVLLTVYQRAPWVSLLFPAWVAAASVLIQARRPDVEHLVGA